jgi:hypothetical protein
MDEKKNELSDEKIAELKQKHGNDLIAVNAPDGSRMVFKKPTKEVWAYFQDGLSKDKIQRSVCLRRLALDCAVLPSPQDASVLFDVYPAFPAVISNQLAELAGQSEDLDVKKL